MIIELRSIFIDDNAKLDLDFSFDMSDFEINGCYPLKQPVHFCGKVSNHAGLVTLSGETETTYSAACDRCAEMVDEPVRFDIDYTLVASLSGEEREDILVVPDYKLDIEEVVRTDVILNLPTKHLCSPNCKGICSACGVNLNNGKCLCDTKTKSAFGAALADLLSE